MNKQPFYHNVELLFTCTSDMSDEVNSKQFYAKLERFMRAELGQEFLPGHTEISCSVEPGDPADLVTG